MSRNGAPVEIAITGIGLRCAVGQNATQSCATVRAGLDRFEVWPPPPPSDPETEGEDEASADAGEAPELAAAAVVPDLGDGSWLEKLEGLGIQPFMEALWMAGADDLLGVEQGWALHLATPPLDRPGVDPEDAESFAEDVREGVLLDAEIPRIVTRPGGQTGVLGALGPACADLMARACEVCVVGGVDSLLHSPYLEQLDIDGRLKTTATPAGLIPGEAAAFVVLETVAHARARQAPVLAQLGPVHLAMETESPAGQSPGRGQAMAQVLRLAVADAASGPARIHRVLNDLNGERWRFLEWALACNPALVALPPDYRMWHPADCFGDIGAATGAAHLCLAVLAFARGYAVGDSILVANTSESGERAALCVSAPPRRS